MSRFHGCYHGVSYLRASIDVIWLYYNETAFQMVCFHGCYYFNTTTILYNATKMYRVNVHVTVNSAEVWRAVLSGASPCFLVLDRFGTIGAFLGPCGQT